MTTLPGAVAAAVEAAACDRIASVTPLGGGMINHAARVDLVRSALFVKWKADAPAGFFASEADGLERLRASGAARVPEVVSAADAGLSDVPFLALEYIEPRPSADRRRFARRFGEALAHLHAATRSAGQRCGLDRDNYIGVVPQCNTPTASWPEFYRDCRLGPQIALARRKGLMPAVRERRLRSICDRIHDLLPNAADVCLVHGELWSGNYIAAGDDAVLIDPSVYMADREIEMAYIELFGGFPVGMLDAYHSDMPLDRGYAERRALLQIYPLLNHLNHFGESYGPDVDRAAAAYAA